MMKILFKKDSGFTLVEVLVAVVVFSFGLLGLAGMMTISVRNNHNGYLRTQANFLAENMTDRMRANPVALWNGTYNGAAAVGADDCALGAPCNFDELAAFDMQQWAQSIQVSLPAAEGTIACVNAQVLPAGIIGADAPSIWFPAPPYTGTCTITISWDESNRGSVADEQQLVLVVQP